MYVVVIFKLLKTHRDVMKTGRAYDPNERRLKVKLKAVPAPGLVVVLEGENTVKGSLGSFDRI